MESGLKISAAENSNSNSNWSLSSRVRRRDLSSKLNRTPDESREPTYGVVLAEGKLHLETELTSVSCK